MAALGRPNTGNPLLDRYLDQLEGELRQAREDLELVQRPGVALATRDYAVKDLPVIDYRGSGGHFIQLPAANDAGARRARTLYVFNNGGGPLTLVAAAKNLVNGGSTFALDAGASLVLTSNGLASWMAVPPPAVDSGGGGAGFEGYWSGVDCAIHYNALSSSNVIALSTGGTGGSYGCTFSSVRPVVVTGLRFFWINKGAKTVRCRLWSQANVALASVDVPVSATGPYTAIFPTPVTTNTYEQYTASARDTTSAFWIVSIGSGEAASPMGTVPIIGMVPFAKYTIMRDWRRWSSTGGDVKPDLTGSGANATLTQFFPVDPIIEPFEED